MTYLLFRLMVRYVSRTHRSIGVMSAMSILGSSYFISVGACANVQDRRVLLANDKLDSGLIMQACLFC